MPAASSPTPSSQNGSGTPPGSYRSPHPRCKATRPARPPQPTAPPTIPPPPPTPPPPPAPSDSPSPLSNHHGRPFAPPPPQRSTNAWIRSSNAFSLQSQSLATPS